jgi:flagellin-specific chaperone FliS
MLKNIPADVAEIYTNTQIATASNAKAVYMLHDRCTHFCVMAKKLPEERAFFRTRVQNILSQLQMSLRITDKTSQGLFYLYDYCYALLERGGESDIENSLEILRILRDTFKKLLRRR